MAFKKKFDGQVDKAIQLGNKENPARESVEGYFLGTKTTPDTGYGPGKLHIFQTAEGAVGVWGKANSNRLLTSDLTGQMCRLTFTGMGEKVKGKNPAYKYELEVDSSETMDTSGIDLNASEPEPEYDGEEQVASESVAYKAAATAPSAAKTATPSRIQDMLRARKSA